MVEFGDVVVVVVAWSCLLIKSVSTLVRLLSDWADGFLLDVGVAGDASFLTSWSFMTLAIEADMVVFGFSLVLSVRLPRFNASNVLLKLSLADFISI